MTSLTPRAIGEIIGVIGIVASLVFVGWELRQNSIATRAANNYSVADSFVQLNLNLSSNRELAHALAANAEDPNSAPLEDKILMLGAWRALFHVWSNVHRQHLNGTVDPDIYEAVLQEMSTYATPQGIRERSEDVERRHRFMLWAWETERFIFNPEFQKLVDEQLGISR
jgi:hypothetical protein